MGYLASRLSSSSLALIEIPMYQDGVEVVVLVFACLVFACLVFA